MEGIATSMYYTFSTIAQVLAAFLALSGVFTIYQIQRFTKSQLIILTEYIKHITISVDSNYIDSLNIHAQLENFIYVANELISFSVNTKILPNKNEVQRASVCAGGLFRYEHQKYFLILLTRISLLIGIIIIVYSLIILANIPNIIACYLEYKTWFITLGILGTALCLVTMSLGIFMSLSINKHAHKV